MNSSTVDFVVYTLGGAVADDIKLAPDCVTVRIVPPDACPFPVLEKLAKGKAIGDVTISAETDDIVLRAHAAKDTALHAANEKIRKSHVAKQFMLDKTPPAAIDEDLINTVGRSLCCDLPVDAKAAFSFESTSVNFTISAPMAVGARVSESDLAYVNHKVTAHEGTLTVTARGNRLLVIATVPISRKRKRKSQQ